MLSIIGIKKTIKQQTRLIIKSRLRLDFTISQPRLLYNPYRPNTVIYYNKGSLFRTYSNAIIFLFYLYILYFYR
jgi:hypothetical protein